MDILDILLDFWRHFFFLRGGGQNPLVSICGALLVYRNGLDQKLQSTIGSLKIPAAPELMLNGPFSS